jgi:RNA polymerase subunit RPABC4/transcription elongation factor Spt4/F0F1-type ATP synthase membrane subunit c/vacuolar-type H+-ATPase subunit K
MPLIREVGPFVIAGFVAFGLAVQFSIVVWTFMDIRARSRDIFVWIFATLLVLVFSIFGLVVYLILRPHETLMQAYERSLEEEALLQEIEERPICPNCRHRVELDFRMCPNCRHVLKEECSNCGRLVEADWTVCPYCTVERSVAATIAETVASSGDGAKPVKKGKGKAEAPTPVALGEESA